jgi:hypothetical protein
MAAGVVDRVWELSDLVRVLEQYEVARETEPTFEPEVNAIGEGWFVRVTFPNGDSDTVRNNFASKAEAVKWIRCEAVVWLWQRREKQKQIAS